jgi:HSP20 family protein
MSISRWDPWGDIVSLREAMNALFEDGYVRSRGATNGVMFGLAVDVEETPEAFLIHASVPGVKPDDVSISLLGDTISIQGERKDIRCSEQDGKWLIRERQTGQFQRSITLPGAVKVDEAQADFTEGVLSITLPKAEQAKARQITVRSNVQETNGKHEAESS